MESSTPSQPPTTQNDININIPSIAVVIVHLLNGDEIPLEGIDMQSCTIDQLKERIQDSDRDACPVVSLLSSRLRLFIGRTCMNDGHRTLASYLSDLLVDTLATTQILHLDMIVSGVHELTSMILSREASDLLIEWIQERRGKEVTGTTLIMRGSEVSPMYLHILQNSMSLYHTHAYVHPVRIYLCIL